MFFTSVFFKFFFLLYFRVNFLFRCWFHAYNGEGGCYEIGTPDTPALWNREQVFYMLLLSLGLMNETAREEKDQQFTINLNIKVNGKYLFSSC